MKATKKQSRFTIADDSIEVVTRIQAWIVADATIRAQHEAVLLEQEFRGHVIDVRNCGIPGRIGMTAKKVKKKEDFACHRRILLYNCGGIEEKRDVFVLSR